MRLNLEGKASPGELEELFAQTLRVPDEWAYYKEDAGKLLVGAFEPVAKPWALNGIPRDFCFDALPDDVQALFVAVAAHRLVVEAESGDAAAIAKSILHAVAVD